MANNGKHKKILLVEDQKSMAEALKFKLSEGGFDVTTVFNGEEAVNTAKKQKFDLILLDLILPKIDGFSVMRELNKLEISIPIVILSNLGQESDIKEAKKLGANSYFIKSNTPLSDIFTYIKKLLA